MPEKKNPPKRYRLDVSSQFYPIMSTKKAQSLFRVVAVLDSPVNPVLLQQAVRASLERYPTFKVRLKRGYAWFFFEENDGEFFVRPSDGRLLRPITPEENNGYLFRVCYEDRKVEMEVFHAVSDGLGAVEFLKDVLCRYALLCGRDLPQNLLDALAAKPVEEEAEDAFYRYYRPIKFGEINLKGLMGDKPLLLEGTKSETGYLSSGGEIGTVAAVECARAKGTTFTALMCGAMAYAVAKVSRNARRRDIVMMVPVNLRKMFPSVTMRNFVNFVRLVFKHNACETVDDYIAEAARQLREKATKEEMEKFFSTTVRTEKSLPLRMAPLWFKIAAARFFRIFLKSRQTVIFSNMGKIDIPAACGVESIRFNLNVSKNSKVNAGAIAVNGVTSISFTRYVKERKLEEAFFLTLENLGIYRTARFGDTGERKASAAGTACAGVPV